MREIMKTFTQWVEDNNLELPVFTDAPDGETPVDAAKAKKTTDENNKRTGYSGNYPPAYIAGQYPDQYFNPIKATAPVDRENMKKRRVVAPPDTAARA
jgi:hypothetical protein